MSSPTHMLRLPRFPPILAPSSSAAPAPVDETIEIEEVVVVLCVGRFLNWLIGLIPIWEEISREEAARIILAREIRVTYNPIIVELDRKTRDTEVD